MVGSSCPFFGVDSSAPIFSFCGFPFQQKQIVIIEVIAGIIVLENDQI